MSLHDESHKPKFRHAMTVCALSCCDISSGMDGERIKQLLRERKLTQRALAERADYSENYLSKMLNNAKSHPFTDEAAARIARALDVDPWDLKDDYAEFAPEEREMILVYRRVPRKNRATARQIATGAFRTFIKRDGDGDKA